jgi:hypothetical protein
MRPNFSIAGLAGILLACAALAAGTENSRDFGEYVVHFNAMATDMLPPRVAREYGITRSNSRGMINITVLKKLLGSPGQPVHARVEAAAVNLAGQRKDIRMREIREGTAIYYIGDFGVSHEETLRFDVRIRPQGTQQSLQVEFSQDFYTQ